MCGTGGNPRQQQGRGVFSSFGWAIGALLPGREIPAPEGAVGQCDDHGGAIPAERHTPQGASLRALDRPGMKPLARLEVPEMDFPLG